MPCSGTSFAEQQPYSVPASHPCKALQEDEAAVADTLASAGMHDDASSEFETRLEHAVQALTAEVQDHSVGTSVCARWVVAAPWALIRRRHCLHACGRCG
jgi:hypothetical protein